MPVEKSGVHITGADSGWPTGNVAAEPPHTKPGNGVDTLHDATSVANHAVQDASSVDEQQTVTRNGTVTGGTFKLGLVIDGEKQVTAALTGAGTLTAAAVQSALEALPGVDGGDVTVTGATGGPFTLTFAGGRFADQDVPALTVEQSAVTGGGNIAIATTVPGVA